MNHLLYIYLYLFFYDVIGVCFMNFIYIFIFFYNDRSLTQYIVLHYFSKSVEAEIFYTIHSPL